MISDMEVSRSANKSAALVFATAALVGIAGFLSIRDNVPSISSPFALFTTLAAFFVFELDERKWNAAVLFALASLPVVAGFLISSLHLFRQQAAIPRRSVFMLGAFIFLSVAWFCFGWAYGIQYQGRSHVLSVAALNAIFISAALALLLINGKTPRFGINLAFHGTMFVWLAWCALPWLGELL